MAKKDEYQPLPNDDTTALKAQIDKLMDAVLEQQEELDQLKAAQVGASAVTVAKQTVQDDLDAELAALQEEFKDYPQMRVFSRRAVDGVDANTDIRLKDEPSYEEDPRGERRKWKLRWFNFAQEGRASRAGAEGYEKVTRADLRDPEVVAHADQKDDYVRKGDRGLEVLHKIPLKLFAYKKKRDRLRLEGKLSSESGLRDLVANGVASKAGAHGENADQAGSFVSNSQGFRVEITPGTTERFQA